jgi:ribose transport system ATP-binding protein
MRGITKRFPGVTALDGVDFELERGEVHVILGENGAGKSTLIKMLSGAYQPDEGEILLDGQRVDVSSATVAQSVGISTIYQEFNLVPQLTVAENIFLGRQPRRLGLVVDRRRMNSDAQQLLERVEVHADPDVLVSALGVAQRQMIEIAKALSLDARILIMDEPTASLSGQEVERLFEIVRDLKEDGVGIIFISHHLEEVVEIGDRVTVLRDGKFVNRVPAGTDPSELVRMMVGRSIEEQFPRRKPKVGDVLLEVKNLSREGVLYDISFQVRAGEVVGIAGIVGAGRTELARAIFGADPVDSGEVRVGGRRMEQMGLREAKRQGIGFITEDRQGQGIVPPLSVAENLNLASLGKSTSAGLVNRGRQRRQAEKMIEDLGIRTPGPEQEVRYLSGGNQANIPVLCLDREASGGEVKTLIVSDNVKGGRMAGEELIRLVGSGPVAQLEGIPGTDPARDRGQGFQQAIDDQSAVKLVASQTANFDRTQGLNVTENILQANPDIKGIFAQNDEMALGAVRALGGKAGTDVKIVGFDGTEDALKAIQSGKMNATVAQQPDKMGSLGVQNAMKIIDGKSVPKKIPVEVKLVTKENVSQFLE